MGAALWPAIPYLEQAAPSRFVMQNFVDPHSPIETGSWDLHTAVLCGCKRHICFAASVVEAGNVEILLMS